jgi:hypothetical protein
LSAVPKPIEITIQGPGALAVCHRPVIGIQAHYRQGSARSVMTEIQERDDQPEFRGG